MKTRQEWEYYVDDISGDDVNEAALLHKSGKEGWELVSIVPFQLCRRAYFKREREIPESQSPPDSEDDTDFELLDDSDEPQGSKSADLGGVTGLSSESGFKPC